MWVSKVERKMMTKTKVTVGKGTKHFAYWKNV
jgi:hypothetical protein